MKSILALTAVAAMWAMAGCEQHTQPIDSPQKIEAAKAEPAKTTPAMTALASTATKAAVEIVVDDKDDGFKVTGEWNSAEGGYWKDNVRWTKKGDGSATATWTPTIPAAGEYEVLEYHGENPSEDHASDAPYTITFSGGTKVVAVDLSDKIGKWNSLGTFKFAAGTSGSVTITNKANNNVIADAVKFVKK